MPFRSRVGSKPPKKQPGGRLMKLPTELRIKIVSGPLAVDRPAAEPLAFCMNSTNTYSQMTRSTSTPSREVYTRQKLHIMLQVSMWRSSRHVVPSTTRQSLFFTAELSSAYTYGMSTGSTSGREKLTRTCSRSSTMPHLVQMLGWIATHGLRIRAPLYPFAMLARSHST